ncbi:hypothetical protein EC988_006896 [Linderina pennispora]|nr:hypothetical protein EC988_006896 [Linderina pennispora]
MTVRSSMCWTALQSLHIHQYTMAPRENTRLCISARNMPALEELAIGRMEPCDNHHPAPTTMDASQVPQLRGRFAKLVRIKAPVFDIGSLRVNAPVLRYLNITGTGTGGGSSDTGASMLPTGNDIRSLVSAGIPLQRAVVCGQVVPLNE